MLLHVRSKKDKFCPYCNERWRMNIGISQRIRKYGETRVICLHCKRDFPIDKQIFIKCESDEEDIEDNI